MKTITLERQLVMKVDTRSNCKPVYCITTGKIYPSVNEVAQAIGVGAPDMSHHLSGRSKTLKRMKFCLVTEMNAHVLDIAKETERLVQAANTQTDIESKVRKEYQEKLDIIKALLN